MVKKCLKSETEKESGQYFMTFLERHKQTCMYLREGINDQTVSNPTHIYVNKVVNSLGSFTES